MRYFFDLKNGRGGYADPEGVDLPNDRAAVKYAEQIAAELGRNREVATRYWRIEVHNRGERHIATVPLITQDRTLGHLAAPLRRSVEEIAHLRYALSEAIETARATRRKTKALVARSRGKPHLVADHGEAI